LSNPLTVLSLSKGLYSITTDLRRVGTEAAGAASFNAKKIEARSAVVSAIVGSLVLLVPGTGMSYSHVAPMFEASAPPEVCAT